MCFSCLCIYQLVQSPTFVLAAASTRQRRQEVSLPHQVVTKKLWNQRVGQEEEAGVDPGWVVTWLHSSIKRSQALFLLLHIRRSLFKPQHGDSVCFISLIHDLIAAHTLLFWPTLHFSDSEHYVFLFIFRLIIMMNPNLHSASLIIWTFCVSARTFTVSFERNHSMLLTSPPHFSHPDLCESAPPGPAGAAPRGPTEAAGAATQAAGWTGGAGAEDEGAADGQRGQTAGTGEHEEGEGKTRRHRYTHAREMFPLWIQSGPETSGALVPFCSILNLK